MTNIKLIKQSLSPFFPARSVKGDNCDIIYRDLNISGSLTRVVKDTARILSQAARARQLKPPNMTSHSAVGFPFFFSRQLICSGQMLVTFKFARQKYAFPKPLQPPFKVPSHFDSYSSVLQQIQLYKSFEIFPSFYCCFQQPLRHRERPAHATTSGWAYKRRLCLKPCLLADPRFM